MSTKTLNLRISDTVKYLSLFNGIFKLTDMEMKVLATFIDLQKELDDAHLEVNAFSTPMKKKAAKKLGKDDFNTLNVYIKALSDKGVISKTTGGYKVTKILLPVKDEKAILFKLTWINKQS